MERQKRGRQDPELDHFCDLLLKSLKEFLFQARNRLQFSEFLNDGKKRQNGVNAVQIFDIGAGPGCAAAGVIKFLWQQNVKLHRVVFLDPVRVWEKAAEAYRQLGIQFKFVTGENGNAENRYDTLQLLKSHIDDTPDAVVSIICLSHVLVDFLLPDYSDQWWRCLRDACGGRRPLILGFDRNRCILPQGLQHGQFATLDYVENEELSSAKSFAFFLESVPQRGDRE